MNSDGRIKATAAILNAGANGAISVYATDNTHVILDIDGYFVPVGSAPGLAFYPLGPCRVADTRQPGSPFGGSLAAGETRAFPILSSSCNIPSGAQSYSLNITAVPQGALTYLSMWPTGQAQPLVSTLNAPTGVITANAAIVPAGANGAVSVYAAGATDLVIDIGGYFGPPATNALWLYPNNPSRILDTRSSSGQFVGTLTVNIDGGNCASPLGRAFVLNATVVPPGPLSYLTVGTNGQQPSFSTLNAIDGAITSNLAITPRTGGCTGVFASDRTQLILDMFGYFEQ